MENSKKEEIVIRRKQEIALQKKALLTEANELRESLHTQFNDAYTTVEKKSKRYFFITTAFLGTYLVFKWLLERNNTQPRLVERVVSKAGSTENGEELVVTEIKEQKPSKWYRMIMDRIALFILEIAKQELTRFLRDLGKQVAQGFEKKLNKSE